MNVELAMSEGDIRRLGDYILDGLAKKSHKSDRVQNVEAVCKLPAEGFISEETFAEIMGIGKSTLRDQVRLGKYPKPRKVTTGRSGWAVDEVRELIERIKKGDVFDGSDV